MVGRHRNVATKFLIPERTVTNRLTVGNAIGDLPEPLENYVDHPDFPNHQRARVTELNIKRFSFPKAADSRTFR